MTRFLLGILLRSFKLAESISHVPVGRKRDGREDSV